jgi:hypothetical protein
MKTVKVILVAMALMFTWSEISPAQPPPVGNISGFVMEADSVTPIAGALVQATVQDTTFTFTDTTGADGSYFIADLQLGLYDVEASAHYFVTQTVEGVEVFADQTTELNFYLERQLCPYIPGDANGNGTFNGLDLTYLVAYFKGGPPPPGPNCHPYCPNQPDPFYAAADFNGDCEVNGLDITFFMAFSKGRYPNIRYCPDCPPAE